MDLTVAAGEVVAMLGANGAGKSTTLRAISSMVRPSAGTVRFDGRDVTGLPGDVVARRGLAHVPEGRRPLPRLTVRENLRLGAFGRRGREVDTDMDGVFDRFERLRGRRDQKAGTLSGGEQQMLVIGRALMSRPKMMMLDEPSLGLSPVLVQEVFRMIRELATEGLTVLLVEQNVVQALGVADRGYVLSTGRVTGHGTSQQLMQDPALLTSYLGSAAAAAQGGGGTVMSRGRFVGSTAIVTGSASGIGRQTAVQFAAEGAQVVVADIDADGASATVAQIEQAGGVARVSITDVGDPSAVEELVERTVADWGRIDILHNNAYWAPLYTAVADTTIEQWDRTIAVTLTGAFLGCKFAIPHMIEAGGGVIVNTASTAAIVASPTFGAYMAAKSGVLGLTRSVAYDYGPMHIRCNAVLPGLIRTAATEPVLSNDERSEWLRSKIVVGRIGEPSDIAHAVLYLASDESSFMTGQTLVIDGGRQIG